VTVGPMFVSDADSLWTAPYDRTRPKLVTRWLIARPPERTFVQLPLTKLRMSAMGTACRRAAAPRMAVILPNSDIDCCRGRDRQQDGLAGSERVGLGKGCEKVPFRVLLDNPLDGCR